MNLETHPCGECCASCGCGDGALVHANWLQFFEFRSLPCKLATVFGV